MASGSRLEKRLNVVNLDIPPLRERKEEIASLCQHFFEKLGPQYGTTVTSLPKELEQLFGSYNWPDNVRELENLVKRYIVPQDVESIQEELGSKLTHGVSEEIDEMAESYLQDNDGQMDLKVISKKAAAVAEKNMITKTLRRMQWNRWKAAKELKVSYKTLLTKIQLYSIET